jgi:hypothetical protein
MIIDTFEAFLAFWVEAKRKPLAEQIEGWATTYMAQWPELLSMQFEDYASQNLDWRQIAAVKVFPYLAARLPAMHSAHQALLENAEHVQGQAKHVLQLEFNATFVIYVGLGCGAGWATSFRGNPAILFGLENIAECGWNDPERIKGLIAHEIGHLAHSSWRLQNGKPIGSGPWWQLYEEGFAQECESLILDTEIMHQSSPGGMDDWLAWCRAHTAWLAAEFLRAVDGGKPVTAFFGSWFEICGRRETGYFLGREVIRELEKRLGLKEIALLEDVEAVSRSILERLAGQNE